MKTPVIIVLGIFFIVLAVGLAWTMTTHTLASPSMVSNSFFSQDTLGSSSGDSFYDERCIDVTQYYSQGYSNLRLDSHGCQIVGIATWVHTITANYYPQTNDAGRTARCGGLGGYSIVGGCCHTTLQLNTYPISGHCGDTCLDCGYNTFVEHGGFERVLNYCTYDQNDLLVAETFAGGQTITKMSLRYPMKSFCRAHPSIITDDVLKQSITSTNIPQTLIDGGSVSIASSQTLTIFYTIENNVNLPTICSSTNNLALDVNNTAVCKSTLGFTYLCSEGQFDALSGTCVVQPESKTLCSQGRYEVGLSMCIYNPPLQVDCGSNNCFYSVDRDICSCSVKDEFVCGLGFELYQPTQSECTGDWELCPQCPIDKVCSTDICIPRCSVGIKCVWANPLVTNCQDANATIRGGECVVNGTTIILCPDTTTYNSKTELCEFNPATVTVCPTGSSKVANTLTGALECVADPTAFHDCPADEIFSNGRCVKQITVYVPQDNNITIYKELNKGCLSDSDCQKIDSLFKCNTANGVCQTPIYYKTNYVPIYIAVGIVVVGLGLLLIFGKKKRRRK